MKELHRITASDIIGDIADQVVERKGISKTLAKQLVLNALIYNCVQEEILGQVYWLMDEEEGQ